MKASIKFKCSKLYKSIILGVVLIVKRSEKAKCNLRLNHLQYVKAFSEKFLVWVKPGSRGFYGASYCKMCCSTKTDRFGFLKKNKSDSMIYHDIRFVLLNPYIKEKFRFQEEIGTLWGG